MKITDFKTTQELVNVLRAVNDKPTQVAVCGTQYINRQAVTEAIMQLDRNEAKARIAAALGDEVKPLNALEKLGLATLLKLSHIEP